MGLVGRVLPGFVRLLANREAFSALVAPVLGRLKVDLLPEQGQLVFNTRETNFPGNSHCTLLLNGVVCLCSSDIWEPELEACRGYPAEGDTHPAPLLLPLLGTLHQH